MPKDEPTAVTQDDEAALGNLWDGLATMNDPKHPAWGALTYVKARLAAEAKASSVPGEWMVEVVARAMCRADKLDPDAPAVWVGDCTRIPHWQTTGRQKLATAAITALSPHFDAARREGIERAAKVCEARAEMYQQKAERFANNFDDTVTEHERLSSNAEASEYAAAAILALPSGPDGAGRGE